jgi:hypothetical protein
LVLQKAGANGLDIHNHGPRHADVTSAAGDPEDYIEFGIQNVLYNHGTFPTPGDDATFNCTGADTVVSVTLALSGGRRGADTSRALVIANGTIGGTNYATTIGLCDGTSDLGGSINHRRLLQEVGTSNHAWATMYYWTGITEVDHTVTVKANDGLVLDSNEVTGSIIVIDLGVDD